MTWVTCGLTYDRIAAVHAAILERRIKANEPFTLLDVRKISEFQESRLKNATHIFLGDLQEHLDEIDKAKPVVTFCGSGRRAIIAASILKRHGFKQVENSLGSMEACEKIGCSILKK